MFDVLVRCFYPVQLCESFRFLSTLCQLFVFLTILRIYQCSTELIYESCEYIRYEKPPFKRISSFYRVKSLPNALRINSVVLLRKIIPSILCLCSFPLNWTFHGIPYRILQGIVSIKISSQFFRLKNANCSAYSRKSTIVRRSNLRVWRIVSHPLVPTFLSLFHSLSFSLLDRIFTPAFPWKSSNTGARVSFLRSIQSIVDVTNATQRLASHCSKLQYRLTIIEMAIYCYPKGQMMSQTTTCYFVLPFLWWPLQSGMLLNFAEAGALPL